MKVTGLFSYSGSTNNLPEDATIPSLFFSQVKKYQEKDFISYFQQNNAITFSWQDMSIQVKQYINLLQTLQVQKGDLIAICSENTPDYIALIIAITTQGAIYCPLHAGLSKKQFTNYLKEYAYKNIFISESVFHQLTQSNNKVLEREKIILIEDIKQKFNEYDAISDKVTSELVYNIYPDDIACIMLSSGTTGSQKGIVLTHDNILSNQRQVYYHWPFINSKDLYLTHLPLSHSYGGLFELYQIICTGASSFLYNYKDLKELEKTFRTIRPSVFFTVPRIWEKIYQSLDSIENMESIRIGFSAGARLNSDIVKYLYENNIHIYQGYGLTETSPSLAIASPIDALTAKGAKILPGVDIKISEESEILARGPNVTQGYYLSDNNNSYYTDDGFLKTGDLGTISEDGYINITGRKNDLIVLSTGEKIRCEEIENKLASSEMISTAVLTGNNRPYLTCIIIPAQEYLLTYARKNSLIVENIENMFSYKQIWKEYQNLIDSINIESADYEQIKKFILTAEVLNEDEMTPTLKLKRHIFEINRAKLLNSLYDA
jgi:long-chain acyl-CoA synthetase